MSTFSTRGLVAFAIILMSLASSTEAAKVPRAVLKEYFQSGDKPTAAQFASFIDSTINFIDDRKLIGLKVYNPQLTYAVGDTAIFNRLAPGATVGAIDLTSSSTGQLEFGGLTGLSPNNPASVDVAHDFAGSYGFMGIKLLNTSTGEINYGYIQMGMGIPSGLPNDPPPIHVHYIVYNDVANEPIEVTAVPEPACATLVLGGLLFLRRRRLC